MIRRPPRSTQSRSSAASDVYKRQRCFSPRISTRVPPSPRRMNARGISSPGLFILHLDPDVAGFLPAKREVKVLYLELYGVTERRDPFHLYRRAGYVANVHPPAAQVSPAGKPAYRSAAPRLELP